MEGARFIPSRRRYGASTGATTGDRIVRLNPSDFHQNKLDAGDPRVRDYEIEVLERLILALRRDTPTEP
jgi:hypothetical protein